MISLETGKRDTSTLFFIVLVFWLLAQIFFLFHDLAANPQTDTQIIAYSFQFLDAVRSGHIGDYLLAVRKYPLFLSLLFSPVFLLTIGSLLVTGSISSTAAIPGYLFGAPVALHFMARLVVFLFALATIGLVYRMVQTQEKKEEASAAAALLASSFLFFVFSTAIRPHILVAFWTLASFAFSLRLAKDPSPKNILGAFGCAIAAFCSLQNGIFAFVFPVWGYLSAQRISLRNILRCIGILAVCGIISLIIGYPFLVDVILGKSAEIGLDLGHQRSLGTPWTGDGFRVFAGTFLGSETLLLIFLVWSTWQRIARRQWERWLTPVMLFLVSYLLLFGFYADTQPRYLIITLPFLALLGARALRSSPFIIRGVFTLLMIAALCKLGWLAAVPNTYQLAHVEVLRRNVPIATDIPYYYLGLIPTRASIGEPVMERERYYHSQASDMSGALPVFSLNASDHAEIIIQPDAATENIPSAPWQSCTQIIASPTGPGIFLWTEARNFWLELFIAQRLGPNISFFCKR